MPDNPQQFRRGRPDSRRRRGRQRPQQQRPAAPPQGQSAQFVITPKPTPAMATKQAEPDYRYVIKDLKNIAMLVGGIVVVYIVLFYVWK